MTTERWNDLVRRLEGEAAHRPDAYRRRVALLGGLGYAVVILSLGLLAAAVIGVVAVFATGNGTALVAELGIAVLVAAAIFARALWVRVPAPEGIELRRPDAPALFEAVDEVRTALGAPKVDHVIVDGDLNASVVQIPRLGPLGWPRNYLTVGLPLMQALSTDEMKGVIAHELGHLIGSHGRTAAWAYRLRKTWMSLLDELERRNHWAIAPYRRFLRWYAPLFQAYSFPLARAQEYEADRAAAQVAGAPCAAGGLARLQVAGRLYGEILWPGVLRRVYSEPEPPATALAAMSPELARGTSKPEASRWLEEGLRVRTDTADTHPSLSDRLGALGLDAAVVVEQVLAQSNGATPTSAARELLGDLEGRLLAQLDAEWRSGVAAAWGERHRDASEAQGRLQALEKANGGEALTVEEAYERASLTIAFRDSEAAIPLLREVIEREPAHADARFALGEALLERGDDEGVVHLDRAMDDDPEAILDSCGLAAGYLTARGREEEATRYRRRAEARFDSLWEAGEERSRLARFDRFEAHGLAGDLVKGLRSELARHDDVKCAHLARKQVRHLSEEAPLYVLAVTPPFRVSSDEQAGRAAQRLADALELPGDFFVVVAEGKGKPVARRVRRGGEEIFRRQRRATSV